VYSKTIRYVIFKLMFTRSTLMLQPGICRFTNRRSIETAVYVL